MANEANNENMTYYEIGYLLAPTIPEAETADTEAELHDEITSRGGEIAASQSPDMRELAYEIEIKDEGEKYQFDRGQFGWVQFSLDSGEVEDLEAAVKNHNDVIRHLLVTVDEADLYDEEAARAREEAADEDEE